MRVPDTRQVRHFGGAAYEKILLTVLFISQENHIPPSCLRGQPGWPSNMITVNEMSAEACEGASGGTSISLMTSCLAWVECPEAKNIKGKQPVIPKNKEWKHRNGLGSKWAH